MSSLSTTRGKVFSVDKHEKGYLMMAIQYNVPFMSRFLKFFLWDESKITIDGEQVKEGEDVIVDFIYDGYLPILKNIERERQGHDVCFRCRTFLEPQNAQRMDNDCCDHIRYEDQKERIDMDLKLVGKSVKEYKYSKGMYLEFSDDVRGEKYNTMIFENNPLFSKNAGVELLNKYRVVGWKEQGNAIDVVEII